MLTWRYFLKTKEGRPKIRNSVITWSAQYHFKRMLVCNNFLKKPFKSSWAKCWRSLNLYHGLRFHLRTSPSQCSKHWNDPGICNPRGFVWTKVTPAPEFHDSLLVLLFLGLRLEGWKLALESTWLWRLQGSWSLWKHWWQSVLMMSCLQPNVIWEKNKSDWLKVLPYAAAVNNGDFLYLTEKFPLHKLFTDLTDRLWNSVC